MADSSPPTGRTGVRKIFTKLKPRKKQKDSEISRRPKVGVEGNEGSLANGPTTSLGEATTSSASKVAVHARVTAGQEKANGVQGPAPTKKALKDIPQGICSPSTAIVETGSKKTSTSKMAETASDSSKGKDLGAGCQSGTTVASGVTDLEGDGQEVVPTPDPQDGKLWYSEKTPMWNEAVEEWKKKTDRKDINKLKAMTAGMGKIMEGGTSDTGAGDWLTKLETADKTPKQIAARLKRWQPILNSVRGIAMAAAAFDPYKIAPIVCASIFGGLDILFNTMHPEDRDKILDTLCQCGNTIKECNSFEITFFKITHPGIASRMSGIRELLKRQYLTALIFACKIRKRCEGMQLEFVSSDEYRASGAEKNKYIAWFARRGKLVWHKLSSEVLEWEGGLKELGRLKSEWAVRKDDLKESIAMDDHTIAVRKWLRKPNFPDPSPSDIRARVMPDDRYSNGADWFLKGDAFLAFCAGLQPPDTTEASKLDSSAYDDQGGFASNIAHDTGMVKRVLWLRGGLGTGKTTILSLVFADLITFGGSASGGESELRIVPYFCDAAKPGTKRADCETIVRAMIRRLALQPDLTLAKAANDFYTLQQSSAAHDGEFELDEHWDPLFRALFTSAGSECRFVFLVDALDECEKPAEWEKLLKFMSGILQSYANVSFICSSHSHVRVDKFFNKHSPDFNIVAIEDVNATSTNEPLRSYINGEIQRRQADAGDSIFYSPEGTDFLHELRNTLLDNARGVFQWAKIWLNILLAVEDTDRMAITSETDARQWLDHLKSDSRQSASDYDKLTSGYQRLWDITCIRGRDDYKQRNRLFQFVLAAFEPPTIQMLSTALRIRNDKFDRSPQPDAIKRLCSNFLALKSMTGSLEFVHSSALNFVRDLNMSQEKLAEGDEERFFSDQRNHESVARLYIDLARSSTHPYWAMMNIGMSKWRDCPRDTVEGRQFMRAMSETGYKATTTNSELVVYFTKHWPKHFVEAARKQSINDPIWKDFIQHLVIPSDSAFGAFLLSTSYIPFGTYPKLYHNPFRIMNFKLHFRGKGGGRCCLRLENGQLTVLPSHVLACLPVFDDYDVMSMVTRDTTRAGDCHELLKDMYMLGGNFPDYARLDPKPAEATALHLACVYDNEAGVRTILDTAKLSSPEILSQMLRTSTRLLSFPLGIAILHRNVKIAAMLLEADRKRVDRDPSLGGRGGLAHQYTSTQWVLRGGRWVLGGGGWVLRGGFFYKSESVLVHAVMRLPEDEMSYLLGVARPEDINVRYSYKTQTLLHYAVQSNKYRLARTLVQVYGADTKIRNHDGKTPFELGTRDENSVLGQRFQMLRRWDP